MTDQTLDAGADQAPGGDVNDGGAQDQDTGGPDRHTDRMKALREADDATLEEMLANAPGMVPGDDEIDDDQEDDDAEGQGLQDDEEHAEGEGSGHEEGERGGAADADDDEGEESGDDAGDAEGLRDDEEVGEGEPGEITLEELESDGFKIVSLPARHPDQEDVQVPLDMEMLEELGMDADDVVQRFSQMRNAYERRQEREAAEAELAEDRDELESIQAELEANPAGFIMSSVSEQLRPQLAEELVLGLDDKAFSALAEKVVKWARTPSARQTEATAKENERLRGERDAAKTARATAAVKKQVREIGTAIRGLIPSDMSERKATRFIKVAASELQAHVRENKLETLDPEEVPGLLADLGVLEDFNVDPNGNGDSSDPESDEPKPRKKRKAAKKKAASSSAGDGKKTKGVRDRIQRRKRAASTPAGAGSAAASGFVKVPGESHKDRMSRLKKHLGVK